MKDYLTPLCLALLLFGGCLVFRKQPDNNFRTQAVGEQIIIDTTGIRWIELNQDIPPANYLFSSIHYLSFYIDPSDTISAYLIRMDSGTGNQLFRLYLTSGRYYISLDELSLPEGEYVFQFINNNEEKLTRFRIY